MSADFSNFCRLCLSTSEFKFSLFTGNILQKIESLTGIEIKEDDNLPKTCCEACVANAYTSYKFQQCVIESDKVLRKKLIDSESHIIEQAKQAPDLFEVLADEGISDNTCAGMVEDVEPKLEILESSDECEFVELDYKVEEIESISDHNDESYNTTDNSALKSFLETTDGPEEKINSEDLSIEMNREYIDVDSYIKNETEMNEHDDQEYCTYITDPENPGIMDLHKLYNKLECKNKKKPGINKKKQKNNEDTNSKFETKLAAYRKKQKDIQSTLICVDCDVKFDSKRLLQRHMIKHRLNKCPFCSVTMRSDNFKRHIQTHTDSPEVCDICGKIAKNRESLRGHINYQHKNSATVKCEFCNREFKSNQHYKKHVRKIHLGIKNLQCHICGKKFFANHDLNKHINMTHKGARPYICPYCKKGFSSPYARKTHIRQHTLETPYRCEICAAGFRQKISLVTHMKSKHSSKIKIEDNPENAV